jgi:hypothetical protein
MGLSIHRYRDLRGEKTDWQVHQQRVASTSVGSSRLQQVLFRAGEHRPPNRDRVMVSSKA